MNTAGLLSLVQNVGLLALLVVVYAAAAEPLARLSGVARQLAYGFVFGGAGVALMSLPIEFAPGLIFDGRSVPMVLAGAFGGGPLAAATAVGLVTGNRFLIGGDGALPASVVSLGMLAISVGLWWLRRRGGPFNVAVFATAGAACALTLFSALFLLGRETALAIAASLGPAYTVTAVSGTALFGYLLLLDDRRREALAAAEEARRAADAANRAKSRFLAQMSHELRTPLTGVLGMLELMRGASLPATHRSYVEAMHSSGQTLLTLVNDILDFSKIEAERMSLSPAPVRVERIAFDVMSFFQPRAREKELALRLNLEDDVPETVLCDDHRVRQILFNLVGNALKFTERGHVEVSIRRDSGSEGEPLLRFEVRDSGIGIDRERQQQIFEPFEQEDGSTTKRFGGSGLGLAISRRLAEIMAGSLTVRSEKGLGSCFVLTLPLVEAPPVGAEAASPAATAAPLPPQTESEASASAADRAADPVGARPLEGIRILVAEDAPVTRLLLGEMLTKLGASVLLVEDGAQAVERVRGEAFDVVLMDMQMPVLDGVEAARQIRALGGAQAELPILALTADVVAEHRRHYQSAGLDGVLHKPVDWSELIAAVTVVRRDRRPSLVAGAAAAEADERTIDETIETACGALPSFDPSVQQALGEAIPAERFREIVNLWAPFAEEHLAQLRGALAADDREGFSRASHSVKGTAGYLGYRRLEALCLLGQQPQESRRTMERLGEEICGELEGSLRADAAGTPLHAVG